MDPKQLTDTVIKAVSESNTQQFNEFMEKSLIPKMEDVSVKSARRIVDQMLAQRSVRGFDVTGLADEQKKDFASQVISAFKGRESKAIRVTKANEALIEEQDNRGGYLVEPEVAA